MRLTLGCGASVIGPRSTRPSTETENISRNNVYIAGLVPCMTICAGLCARMWPRSLPSQRNSRRPGGAGGGFFSVLFTSSHHIKKICTRLVFYMEESIAATRLNRPQWTRWGKSNETGRYSDRHVRSSHIFCNASTSFWGRFISFLIRDGRQGSVDYNRLNPLMKWKLHGNKPVRHRTDKEGLKEIMEASSSDRYKTMIWVGRRRMHNGTFADGFR